MINDPDIAYHLKELDIARNPESQYFTMPNFTENDHIILDIGCGIGQTFTASNMVDKRLLVGLDIDLKCLIYGHKQFENIIFVLGTAEHLPFRDNEFDLVISRVTLPLTNILKSIAEVERVLKSNGRVWFTLHTFSMPIKILIKSLFRLRIKDVVYRSYVILNGSVFNIFGIQFPFFVKKRYETFQTRIRMMKVMTNAGFTNICLERKGKHFICTAQKR